ncbi:hypothetical protein B4135_2753 [Caldibacillus debilis]|uniref:Uncharacterized protein n=1 Tax=Caldibacillus debilis TaxID=301148 RepID=A0A150LQM1_9BACI|nr:hypothetical protein B4135_2753 [Caldibacillus debilis]
MRLIFSCRGAATLGVFHFPAKNFRPLAANACKGAMFKSDIIC